MGEGLKRVAEACGGMRVSARGVTCDYVLRSTWENDSHEIRERERSGWKHIGSTPDGKFLQFTRPTPKDKQ